MAVGSTIIRIRSWFIIRHQNEYQANVRHNTALITQGEGCMRRIVIQSCKLAPLRNSAVLIYAQHAGLQISRSAHVIVARRRIM